MASDYVNRLPGFGIGGPDHRFELRLDDGWACVTNGHALVAVRDAFVDVTSDPGSTRTETVTRWLSATVPSEVAHVELRALREGVGDAVSVLRTKCTTCLGSGRKIATLKRCECSCGDCDCCLCADCEDGEVRSDPPGRPLRIADLVFNGNLIALALNVVAGVGGVVSAWISEGAIMLRSDSLFVAAMPTRATQRELDEAPRLAIEVPTIAAFAA